MSLKEEMIFDHDVEGSQLQELDLFKSPQLQLETPGTEITMNNNDQTSSSVVNPRPRGRPLGSKNKLKIPIVETHVNRNVLSSHVLEITHGVDLSTSLMHYARHHGQSICILNGNGLVENIKLRQPTGKIFNYMGRFKILLISGTILPSEENAGDLTILLSDTNEQEIGGSVVPPLMASGTVKLTVASFANTTFEKLPSVE
ncbi:hypothetical protein TSUD_264160 [Trifolium subterraneum]|uniref:PPC domain-containing protein n=1 Tax=Trifolium subterraneum TaxID=3900 RepID=A0A2Z6NNJ9_TRISU|nr:hypothetical protein TSUD_264160 [Trifolium subterraneum]